MNSAHSAVVKGSDLSQTEKRLLFWASFLSLTAAGFGFAFRVAKQGTYGTAFKLSEQEVGQVFGASLWPIAITMIGFSLIVDRTGYKLPMYGALILQAASGVGTFFAESHTALYIFALCAGLGHGIVEAVINPICAAVYPREKTKWLTILHAAWPAGLVGGTLLIIMTESIFQDWRIHALWILLPVLAYGVMYLRCRFPVDERVQAGVPYIDMLRQVGFLGAALASFMVIYEIGNQVDSLTDWVKPDNWFSLSLYIGLGVGVAFGAVVRSIGQPLFFLMCVLMIPVATAELGTDGWIKGLMTPVLKDMAINPAFALVFSAFIMLFFRVFAGRILGFFNPPTLLCLSGVFSAVGLWWLSGATGIAIFVAFVLYAIGQTYYWPCVLGFTAERYPRGGALTLNTVSAIGLLAAGVVGTPILGAAFDRSIQPAVEEGAPALAEASTKEAGFMWMKHEAIDPKEATAFIDAERAEEGLPARNWDNDPPEDYKRSTSEEVYAEGKDVAGRDVLQFAAIFPAILFVVFGLIALYFKSRGGYKPIILGEQE
ncbi:MAG: MFS transporter [Planctomycetota bacterium]